MSKKNLTYIPLKPMRAPRKTRIQRQRNTFAVDWDGTLVDDNDNFLPGALDALRQLSNHGDIILHSCRGNYYEGALGIKGRLAEAGISVSVWTGQGKPLADVYIDDRGLRFNTWEETLETLRNLDLIGKDWSRRD